MKYLQSFKTITLAIILSIGISYAYAAWSPPSTMPTGGNAEAPVNVGGATQVKSGALTVNGFLQTMSKFGVSAPPITSDTELGTFKAPSSTAGNAYVSFGSDTGGYVGWDYGAGGLSVNAHAAGGAVGGIFVKRVDNNHSNVGIGTVNPLTRLGVVGGVDSWSADFYGLPTSNTVRIGTLSGVATIGANNNAGSAWADLSINPGGNVGIGVASPQAKLDVNGEVGIGNDRANSAFKIGSFGHKIGREPSDGSLYIGGGQANIILQNNVGIGVASPGVGLKLGVAGNVGADKYCNRDGNACITNTGGGIQFPDGTTQSTAFTGGGGGSATIETQCTSVCVPGVGCGYPGIQLRICNGGSCGGWITVMGGDTDGNSCTGAILWNWGR